MLTQVLLFYTLLLLITHIPLSFRATSPSNTSLKSSSFPAFFLLRLFVLPLFTYSLFYLFTFCFSIFSPYLFCSSIFTSICSSFFPFLSILFLTSFRLSSASHLSPVLFTYIFHCILFPSTFILISFLFSGFHFLHQSIYITLAAFSYISTLF